MSHFSSVIMGNESLVIQCGEILLDGNHSIRAVVTRNEDVRLWATKHKLPVIAPGPGLADRLNTQLRGERFDWLLSIANLDIIPEALLQMPDRGAVNFHDGPLPEYAGLNVPVWAALAGETEHGISWHLIEGGVDEGDVIASARFEVTERDTALTLNTKCYAAAIDSFPTVVAELAKPEPQRQKQELSKRGYFARDTRPQAGARLDFTRPAVELERLIRALDHGDYWNPLCIPKFEAGGQVWLARAAHIATGASGAAPGAVLAADGEMLSLATGAGDLVLTQITDCNGKHVPPQDITRVGAILPSPTAQAMQELDAALAPLAASDPVWRGILEAVIPPNLPLITATQGAPQPIARPVVVPDGVGTASVHAAFALLGTRLSDSGSIDLALHVPAPSGPGASYITDWRPVRLIQSDSFAAMTNALQDACAEAQDRGPFVVDLIARLPGGDVPALPELGLSNDPEAGLVPNTVLTLAMDAQGRATLFGDKSRISDAVLDLYAARLSHLLTHLNDSDTTSALPILPESEREKLVSKWNRTATTYDPELCVHQAFEAQVARTPEAEALAFEGQSLSYAELDAASNRMAHRLIAMGVTSGTIVGLHLPRSAELVIAALAIMKAGGAYLPIDPTYPSERTALCIEDSRAAVIVTDAKNDTALTKGNVQIFDVASDLSAEPDTVPNTGVTGADLAYVIYTSGSTGRPKGVMVEHRNVINFFVGMDERIDHGEGDVWFAVTSLSFDISVLELFWTLARGFKIVLSGDESRAQVAGDVPTSKPLGGMEFSLYYWGNDDGVGRDKYRSLLEGAKFADQNGFCAVWTPERHFHAFGGPYPNPSVTGAAVAGCTKNIGVRAGSCVAPLHHTARIAEEWAVIDNLTNGRAGLAIASGWQPDDFVLRPENTPPENKPAMFRQIADLRKLWAGEPVEFPRKDGEMHAVITQPRPISPTPDLWVTTAGNPETWREAGRNGCHVLTHLLGQSIGEVADKIKIYHAALREAGHDPTRFKVTLMLHSFLAATRDEAREIAREPMKDYLRSAAGLIKQYAWAFPAFKKPEGVDNAFQLDLGSLTEEELEGILDFAFERYFNDSGLFGTIEDAMDRVTQVKAIGVTEIACLIDYGIAVDTILQGLEPLAEVVRRANESTDPASDDYSIAAQIARHNVTHLQCTPSMARMLVMNDEAGAALHTVKHLMVGGEALPGALVGDLTKLTSARIQNMYGPTETTIWSTTHIAQPDEGLVRIGTPIANTQVYILDEDMALQPIGLAGELHIGGAGVTRGYWDRPELTAERFVSDPFADHAGARLYRTGDLARWRMDGTLEFIGRTDFQVKLRGYRIELGEIESAIDQLEGIRQSVVVVREDQPGLHQLVAYLLADTEVEEIALRTALAGHLPAHMIPARFVQLESFPLTPNKKVDRKALPAPARTVAPKTPARTQPTETNVQAGDKPATINLDEITASLAAIWTETLGVGDISPRDNFFDLGGHSLLAVQAHREIRTRLAVPKLSITDIFRFPVLSDLATSVHDKLGGAGTAMPTSNPAPAEPAPINTENAAPEPGTGNARADAMARRREMRARRARQPGR
ncbi:peptide synthetase [Ruegeria sp. ANG-R]|uniref:MupA/Atu3671 family FMN-dependent luciferase-like monooxygenase n=1 Tax=Ruegeria sp. ANG-R TaxID=1577903 RepID=UPI00057EDF8E|nr:MupA/Atu3671 family FMN-dependent luciferase-like monooxygenase [Ruegeria sp. ANG-R]KIC41442.1 peptide synthetase [Ruegeria sp. ANG-R]